MSIINELNEKEREKFRKLLEVANSTQYIGEKEAALAAATRIANSKGMTLREAVGLSEIKNANKDKLKKKDSSFFRAKKQEKTFFFTDSQSIYAEKQRYEKAMADAINRGLEVEAEKPIKKRREYIRTKRKSSSRSRPDFIRVLIRETKMSSDEIAKTAGVSIYDVMKEKLLMRKKL